MNVPTQKKYRAYIYQDSDNDCPNDWGGWKVVSFHRRHINRGNRDDYLMRNRDGERVGVNVGIRRKLATGTAFVLDYYEHGGCAWSLSGEGQRCPFDSVGGAGILLWQDAVLPPGDYEQRRKSAASFLETYTSWCNGEVYHVRICEVVEDPDADEVDGDESEVDGDDVDSCGGIYDVEAYIKEALGDAECETIWK